MWIYPDLTSFYTPNLYTHVCIVHIFFSIKSQIKTTREEINYGSSCAHLNELFPTLLVRFFTVVQPKKSSSSSSYFKYPPTTKFSFVLRLRCTFSFKLLLTRSKMLSSSPFKTSIEEHKTHVTRNC